jgi:hypothetical protein
MRNIVSILLIVASIALFALFTSGRSARVTELRAEANSFDNALERSKELIAVRDSLLSKYNAFPTDSIARLNTMIPESIDTVRLIIDVNTLASRYDMSLAGISIGVPDENLESDGALGPSGEDYGRLSLTFSVTASYDRFRAFLTDLERSLRMIDVTALTFSVPDDGSDRMTYGVTLTTYWLK